MTKETILLCGVYPQINNALYVAWKQHQNGHVTLVIYENQNLLKFFREINDKVFHSAIDIKFIEAYRPRNSKSSGWPGKLFNVFWNIWGERRYLKAAYDLNMAGIQQADVYFFRRYFCGNEYFWLNKLKRKNSLIFMPSLSYDYLGIKKAPPANLWELAHLLRWKLAYSSGIAMSRHPLGLLVPYIPDEFLEKNVSRIIDGEDREKMLRELDMQAFRVFSADRYDVMYFHDDLITSGYITDSSSFNKLLVDIFELLGRYFPENRIGRKFHPSIAEGEMEKPFGIRIPDYIPAEFLFNDNVKVYLGISSMALANVENGQVVSLIDMVTFKDEATGKGLKDIITRAGKTAILFPRTLEEFERIIEKAASR